MIKIVIIYEHSERRKEKMANKIKIDYGNVEELTIQFANLQNRILNYQSGFEIRSTGGTPSAIMDIGKLLVFTKDTLGLICSDTKLVLQKAGVSFKEAEELIIKQNEAMANKATGNTASVAEAANKVRVDWNGLEEIFLDFETKGTKQKLETVERAMHFINHGLQEILNDVDRFVRSFHIHIGKQKPPNMRPVVRNVKRFYRHVNPILKWLQGLQDHHSHHRMDKFSHDFNSGPKFPTPRRRV
jgi:hypothetical protein